jgi:hypothetical protein
MGKDEHAAHRGEVGRQQTEERWVGSTQRGNGYAVYRREVDMQHTMVRWVCSTEGTGGCAAYRFSPETKGQKYRFISLKFS